MSDTKCLAGAVPCPLWKKILFRIMALLLGLSPLLFLEGACRWFDWGRPTFYDDPFVGFSDIHPLFVYNPQTGRYQIAESRLEFFCPESFDADKPADEFRIFVLGGSTVRGRPYEIQTSFTAWLELSLNAAAPGRSWRVINCGGVSYASYRLVPILQECLDYQPDLIIFCEGHNEFLEDRSYAHIKELPPYLSWPKQQVSRLRTYNLLRVGLLSLAGENPYAIPEGRPLLGPEADTRLDYKGGMNLYHRDEAWRDKVFDHFDFNLRRMAALCQEADVPLLFVCPVANLDWPPFKSQHRDDLTKKDRDQFHQLLETARKEAVNSFIEAIPIYLEALALDDRFALAHYELGECYRELGMLAEAKQSLFRAKEEDVCPLRMLDALRQRMLQAGRDTGTPLVDTEELIASKSASGYPGNEWLIDHVHPKVDGHKLIAGALVEELTRQGIVQPVSGWEPARDLAYRKHFSSLNAAYFVRGQIHLEAEQKWAYGKVPSEKGKRKKEKGKTQIVLEK